MTDGGYKFCPKCASPLSLNQRGGRERLSCTSCGFVLYRNPIVGVAVVVQRRGKVLLGLRAGSYTGQWCIPCGYVEWDEEIRAAAAREFEEETGLAVNVGSVLAAHSNFHNPAQHTVGIWFRGRVVGGILNPGDDLADARYFALDGLPDELAFPTDRIVLDQLQRERSGRVKRLAGKRTQS